MGLMNRDLKSNESEGAPSIEGGQGQESDSVIAYPSAAAGVQFLAVLAIIGAAAGNSVKVRTSIAPGPLNLSLDIIIRDDLPSPLSGTLDFLLEPFRCFQDRCGWQKFRRELK
jgi:hypothetical protein